MQSQVQVMYRYGVGLGLLKAVQGQESTSLRHGQISYFRCMYQRQAQHTSLRSAFERKLNGNAIMQSSRKNNEKLP